MQFKKNLSNVKLNCLYSQWVLLGICQQFVSNLSEPSFLVYQFKTSQNFSGKKIEL